MCVLNTKLDADDILKSSEKIRNAKRQVFENLEVALQVEPYNVHDRNSIVCSIEDVEAKLQRVCYDEIVVKVEI